MPPSRGLDGGGGVVLDGVPGQVHEGLLQRDGPGAELEQGDAVLGGLETDGPRGQPRHVQFLGADLAGDLDAGAGQHLAQAGRLVGGHGHGVAAGPLDQLLHGGVGEQAPAADDDQVVGDQRHLAHQVRGDEDSVRPSAASPVSRLRSAARPRGPVR